MNNAQSWATYITAIRGADTNADTARKTGVSEATVGRWVNATNDPKPRQVVTMARAYGQNPLSALVITGYLTEREAESPVALPAAMQLANFSDLELAHELVRRIESGEAHPDLEAPIGDVVGGSTHDLDQLTDDELAERHLRLVADESDAGDDEEREQRQP